jgi:hypothetical protein
MAFGTGLARPDVFDWMEEYPAMIGSEHPDAVIVAIGANDGQGFQEDGKVLAFGSDAWVQVYQQRIAAFLSLLTQNGATVDEIRPLQRESRGDQPHRVYRCE